MINTAIELEEHFKVNQFGLVWDYDKQLSKILFVKSRASNPHRRYIYSAFSDLDTHYANYINFEPVKQLIVPEAYINLLAMQGKASKKTLESLVYCANEKLQIGVTACNDFLMDNKRRMVKRAKYDQCDAELELIKHLIITLCTI